MQTTDYLFSEHHCSKCGKPIDNRDRITYNGRCEDCFGEASAKTNSSKAVPRDGVGRALNIHTKGTSRS